MSVWSSSSSSSSSEPRPDRVPQQEPEPLRVKEEWVEVRVGEEEREVLKQEVELLEADGSDQNQVHPAELLRTEPEPLPGHEEPEPNDAKPPEIKEEEEEPEQMKDQQEDEGQSVLKLHQGEPTRALSTEYQTGSGPLDRYADRFQ
ncbi:coiled-coil domain-containing protein 96-like isoform X3 [Poecilia reticulata]|uniref:coiled-coil domain-containing protein 96-like isoform X3 n=1 Tax=Poecilia reticulata TaxID=8081 RepID=UPI0004A36ED0|nr:PREDICTED: coiled-coil domain-containing protein 96-like isoform X3 [Poecilia reticulata]